MPECIAVDPQTERPIRVHWEGTDIAEIEQIESNAAASYASPGFIDIQINGFAGVNFGDPDLTVDNVRKVTQRLWETGVTYFLPTLITDSAENMAAALARLRVAAEESDLRDSIVGFHMEGPYLSSVDGPRGAHPLAYTKDPDWDEFQRFQDAAGGMVRMMTLAPERDGALAFIEKAVESGVRIAIGHTAASRQQILDAVAAGATLSTHLGNAAHDMLQRHHNYIYDQLAEDGLMASIIVDGHHLPPHLVKIFLRVKGPERIVLTSDAVQYAGLPPGIYDGGYRKFEVRADGFIGVVGEPRLAGSGLLLIRGIENTVRFTEATLADAVNMATVTPAKFLGMDQRLGSLQPGKEASMVLFSWNPETKAAQVEETIVAGRRVFKT